MVSFQQQLYYGEKAERLLARKLQSQYKATGPYKDGKIFTGEGSHDFDFRFDNIADNTYFLADAKIKEARRKYKDYGIDLNKWIKYKEAFANNCTNSDFTDFYVFFFDSELQQIKVLSLKHNPEPNRTELTKYNKKVCYFANNKLNYIGNFLLSDLN